MDNSYATGEWTMRILMVEDDAALCDAVLYHIRREGYEADSCQDGEEALYHIRQNAYDLVILDRMLPSLDGISVLGKMRREGLHTPVLMVTALDGIGERVTGLDAGADDYLVKPFAVEELMARVRSLSRRPTRLESTRLVSCGDVELDISRQYLYRQGDSVMLSRREAQLMAVLMRGGLQVLTRGVLLARVWGSDAPVENGNLDSYIHFLRAKLKKVGSTLQIKTIRSVGYQLHKGE